jgi:hypothetical protein
MVDDFKGELLLAGHCSGWIQDSISAELLWNPGAGEVDCS